MIRYVVGDATEPQGAGPKIIAHVCNDAGGWGAGFVLALSRRWPAAEECYRRWATDTTGQIDVPFRLGESQLVGAGMLRGEPVYVVNMIAQRGFPSPSRPVALSYPDLRQCLGFVQNAAEVIHGTVHMPRIGCGIAGGSWPEVERIINETLVALGIDVTVYDLPTPG